MVLGIAYQAVAKYRADNVPTQYVLASVEKGSLITSVSGSGQVAVSSQVESKAKASGDILKLMIVDGQPVKSGQVLAYLNAVEAQKSVRDAEVNLQSAKLALEKLKKPSEVLTITQAQNALAQAEQSKQKAADAVTKAYEDTSNAVANAFLDLPTIMAGLDDVLHGTAIAKSEPTVLTSSQNFAALTNSVDASDQLKLQALAVGAENDYQLARTKYNKVFELYKSTTRYSDHVMIEKLLAETFDMAKTVSQSEKSQSNFVDAWIDSRTRYNFPVFAQVKTYKTNIATYISQTNTHLSSLLSITQSLQDNKNAIINADQSIVEKQQSLEKLRAGTDTLDLQSSQLSVVQRQNTLIDARAKLADYTVRAPFDGIIAKVNVKLGDAVGVGTSIATVVTPQQTATISLNEIDVAKIKIDQKVTMTFDAVDGLTVTGHVAEIDTLGTVSQGVVTYNVKILFDTQDVRVKPGMSVSAVIVTDIHQDVLIAPNAAIKTRGTTSYVETLDPVVEAVAGQAGATSPNAPVQKNITIGLSNDTQTEIVSGLSEGDQVITRTITPTTGATTQAPSLFGAASGNRGATGATRATGR